MSKKLDGVNCPACGSRDTHERTGYIRCHGCGAAFNFRCGVAVKVEPHTFRGPKGETLKEALDRLYRETWLKNYPCVKDYLAGRDEEKRSCRTCGHKGLCRGLAPFKGSQCLEWC